MIIHHLGHSQSERIVWLCEELDLSYELRTYQRDPVTRLSPPELEAKHPLGAAPLLEEGALLLAESPAIVEYILAKHGDGRLRLGPDHPAYAAYLYWFHFANGALQSAMYRLMMVNRASTPDHPVRLAVQRRFDTMMQFIDAHLGEATYLAGDLFTAADIMSVFSLTTMRLFQPVDLQPYLGIRGYLQRIGARPAYRRAMAKGDPDLVPLLA